MGNSTTEICRHIGSFEHGVMKARGVLGDRAALRRGQQGVVWGGGTSHHLAITCNSVSGAKSAVKPAGLGQS